MLCTRISNSGELVGRIGQKYAMLRVKFVFDVSVTLSIINKIAVVT